MKDQPLPHRWTEKIPPGRDPEPEFAEKLAFLRSRLLPETEIETHAAHVFLTRKRAWKIKKPIALTSFDHTGLEARERACREELRLNRQLAGPSVYLDLVGLTVGCDGRLHLSTEGVGGAVIDWIVLMRRLPAERMLDVTLARGETVAAAELDAIARTLGSFYRARREEPTHPGLYLRHLHVEAEVNRRHLLEMAHHVTAPDIDALTRKSLALLEAAGPDIAKREAARLVLEGHGDLRPEHVCLTHPPVIFDRIETIAAQRRIDVGDELGFLGIECALLGDDRIGPELERLMAAEGFPPPPESLKRCYGLFRCLTRARLCLDHLRDPVPRKPAHWPPKAEEYFAFARRLLV